MKIGVPNGVFTITHGKSSGVVSAANKAFPSTNKKSNGSFWNDIVETALDIPHDGMADEGYSKNFLGFMQDYATLLQKKEPLSLTDAVRLLEDARYVFSKDATMQCDLIEFSARNVD